MWWPVCCSMWTNYRTSHLPLAAVLMSRKFVYVLSIKFFIDVLGPGI